MAKPRERTEPDGRRVLEHRWRDGTPAGVMEALVTLHCDDCALECPNHICVECPPDHYEAEPPELEPVVNQESANCRKCEKGVGAHAVIRGDLWCSWNQGKKSLIGLQRADFGQRHFHMVAAAYGLVGKKIPDTVHKELTKLRKAGID